MNQRLTAPDCSLNVNIGDGSECQRQDWLEDEGANPEQAFAEQEDEERRSDLLATALATLNKRERHILTERRLKDEPQALAELAQRYGVSRERVRQIEARAFAKVQKAMGPPTRARQPLATAAV
jgi:RNA polymerase sigma-32 factor